MDLQAEVARRLSEVRNRTFPIVVISGARQAGKSTFLQNESR